MPVAGDIVSVLTHLGSLPVTAARRAAHRGLGDPHAPRHARGRRARSRRYAVTYAVVHIGKAATDRPRPSNPHASAEGMAYPSGHSAYAVALVACAIVLARGGHRLAARFALVGIAIALAVGGRPPRASTCACTTSPT